VATFEFDTPHGLAESPRASRVPLADWLRGEP
jgi:hypothetical protein